MSRVVKILSVSTAAALLILAFVAYRHNTSAVAEGEIIGYVDSDAVLEAYGPAKDVNTELDTLRASSEDNLKKKVAGKFGPGDVSALPQESQMEVQKMVEEADAQYKQEMTKLQNEKWLPIVQKINDTIKTIGQEHKVVVILDKQAVISGGIDLTDEVIKRLSAQQ
jgi:Skp family chaperone for outer membrane proteins